MTTLGISPKKLNATIRVTCLLTICVIAAGCTQGPIQPEWWKTVPRSDTFSIALFRELFFVIPWTYALVFVNILTSEKREWWLLLIPGIFLPILIYLLCGAIYAFIQLTIIGVSVGIFGALRYIEEQFLATCIVSGVLVIGTLYIFGELVGAITSIKFERTTFHKLTLKYLVGNTKLVASTILLILEIFGIIFTIRDIGGLLR